MIGLVYTCNMYFKYPKLTNKKWLENEVENKPLRQIAEEVGSSYSAIVFKVKKYKIQVPIRKIHRKSNKPVWNKGLHPLYMQGENHHNWKGGITSVNHSIRTSVKFKDWRTAVFIRDNYTCQECGKHGGWLEADHKKQFALILKENNIKTLKKALKCEELWDVNNGRTLCKECHKKTGTHSRREF